MTQEEKYKEIVANRQVANGGEGNPSGETKADPQAEKKDTATGNDKVEGKQQPEAEGVQKQATEKQAAEGSGADEGNKAQSQHTEDEKQNAAFAKLRFENKRLNERLKALEAEREAKNGGKPAENALKKRAEFQSDDEYTQYIFAEAKRQAEEAALSKYKEQADASAAREKGLGELKESISNAFGAERADSIWKDLNDPESVMSQIITDERGEVIAKAVNKSPRRADLLALMQAKPAIFQEILELDPERQKYRMFALEDAIEARYKNFNAEQQQKQQQQEQAKERAASVPVTGTFGVNGNANTDFSSLSTEERVARYKEEMRKKLNR